MRQWLRGAAVLVLVLGATASSAQAAVAATFHGEVDDDDHRAELRAEVETLINVLASADPDTGRIVIREGLRKDLQGVPLGMILNQIARGNEDGTISLRDDIDIDPYLEMVRRFLEAGGAERLEGARRRLEEKYAEGEDAPGYQLPDQDKFRKTLERVQKLLARGESAPEGAETPSLPEPRGREPQAPQLPGFDGLPLEALERLVRLERAGRELQESARKFRRELSGVMEMLRERRRGSGDRRGPRAQAREGVDQLRRIIDLWRALAPKDGSRQRLDELVGLLELLQRLLDVPMEGLDGRKLVERLLKDANPEDLERLMETVFRFTESELGQRLIALAERVMARVETFLDSPEGHAAQEWVERLLKRGSVDGMESEAPKAPRRTAPTRMAW